MPSAESLAGLEIPTLQDTGRSESASVNPADVADPGPPVVKHPAKQKDVPLQPFIVGEGLPAYHPYCRFRHVYANPGCQGDHRAVDCRR